MKMFSIPSVFRRVFLATVVISIVLLVWTLRQTPVENNDIVRSARPSRPPPSTIEPPSLRYPPANKCHMSDYGSGKEAWRPTQDPNGPSSSRTTGPTSPTARNQAKVLLIPQSTYSTTFKTVVETLVYNRVKYKSSVSGKNLPDLTKAKAKPGLGKYGAIFFEDFRSYLEMDPWNRELLDKYCKTYNAGIIAVVPPTTEDGFDFTDSTLHDIVLKRQLPLKINTVHKLEDLSVAPSASMLHLTRGGRMLPGTIDQDDVEWVSFASEVNESFYEPVVTAKDHNGKRVNIVMQDLGSADGIPKVIFGGNVNHWVNRLLFLDALSWVSRGRIAVPLTRYIMVDIDDVFVGRNRFLPEDVSALIKSQDHLQESVPGFRYNLGFSGGYFHHSEIPEELAGDDAIMRNKDKFWWFPHMWKHWQAHEHDNVSALVSEMELNKKFAQEMGISTEFKYSVAPHHSGVYPVHEQLYEAWKRVWDIEVTSTEEYPHLRPARLRRGFVHRGVKVLPRQTCGLFTKNLFYEAYPGGPEVLEKSINGGELFQTIVNNRVSIFMTHMPNYGHDRLAPYTFESVIQMIKCWTNLDLRTRNPRALADIYFEMFPDEKVAIWGNPCDDHRHMDIWSESKSCNRLPDILIVGPQKTGTTALYSFLKLHPSVESNKNSPSTFEEPQFFSNAANYELGVDWYMDLFPAKTAITKNNMSTTPRETYLFEKSATYFDKDVVPLRAKRLLPRAKVLAVLISPVQRAYSWYQHMRAHDDPTALAHSFHDVVTADITAERPLRALQSRCLEPGKYAAHLERWLLQYKARQLHVVDGEEIKYDPVSFMNRLQRQLNIQPFVDYAKKIRYDKRKGFYCSVVEGKKRPQCLGKGKGRHYAPISPETQKYLRNFYRPHNEALVKLLSRLGYTTPDWLEEDLKDGKDDMTKLEEGSDEKDTKQGS